MIISLPAKAFSWPGGRLRPSGGIFLSEQMKEIKEQRRPPIRALAVDIDGTLSDRDRVLSASALTALGLLRSRGVPVILATGNTHCFTRTTSVLLGTPPTFISENGGVISLSEGEMQILADLSLCEEAFRRLSLEFPLNKFSSSRYRFTDIALERNFDLKAASSRLEEMALPVELIDTTYAVHIKDRRVDKGTGLLRIAGHMAIEPSRFAAIGDSISDLPMFRLAGFKASVGNAGPELKGISDYVAHAEYGEGFAEIIDYMIQKSML